MAAITYLFRSTQKGGFSFPYSDRKDVKKKWTLEEIDKVFDYKLNSFICGGAAAVKIDGQWVGSLANYDAEEGGFMTHQGAWVDLIDGEPDTTWVIDEDVITTKLDDGQTYYLYEWQNFKDLKLGRMNNLIGYPYSTAGPTPDGTDCTKLFTDPDGRNFNAIIKVPNLYDGTAGAASYVETNTPHWVGSYYSTPGSAAWVYFEGFMGQNERNVIETVWTHPTNYASTTYYSPREQDGTYTQSPWSHSSMGSYMAVFPRTPEFGGYGIKNIDGIQLMTEEFRNTAYQHRPTVYFGGSMPQQPQLDVSDHTGGVLDTLKLKTHEIDTGGNVDHVHSFSDFMGVHDITIDVHSITYDGLSNGCGLPEYLFGTKTIAGASTAGTEAAGSSSGYLWIEGAKWAASHYNETGTPCDPVNGMRPVIRQSDTRLKIDCGFGIANEPNNPFSGHGVDISDMKYTFIPMGFNVTRGTNGPVDVPTFNLDQGGGSAALPNDMNQSDLLNKHLLTSSLGNLDMMNHHTEGIPRWHFGSQGLQMHFIGGNDNGINGAYDGGSGFDTGTPRITITQPSFLALAQGVFSTGTQGNGAYQMIGLFKPAAGTTFRSHSQGRYGTYKGAKLKYRIYDPINNGWFSAKWVDHNGTPLPTQPKACGTNESDSDLENTYIWGQHFNVLGSDKEWFYAKGGDEGRVGLQLEAITNDN